MGWMVCVKVMGDTGDVFILDGVIVVGGCGCRGGIYGILGCVSGDLLFG